VISAHLRRAIGSAPLILIGCGLILFLRRPDQFHHPQFWAEDGFFYERHLANGWHTLVESYAGYLHTLPRLIAGTAWWWNPIFAPAWFVGCSALATLYVASRALSSRQAFSPRPLLALSVVLVPDAFEVLLNVVNLQWLVAAGLILLLLSRDPETAAGTIHDLIAALIMGVTGPFSIMLAPFFFIRALVRKSSASRILAGLVALTAAVQTTFILRAKETVPADARIQLGDGVSAIGSRLAGSLFTGGRMTQESPMAVLWILALFTVVLVGVAGFRRGPEQLIRGLLAGAFLALLAASLYRCRWNLPELRHAGYGARYFFPLQLALLWLLFSFLGDSQRVWRGSAIALLILAFATNVPRLREPAFPDLHWGAYAPKISKGEAVVIPINPAGWTIPLPARPAIDSARKL